MEKVIEAVVKTDKYRTAAWSLVIEEGRKYAMMKTHRKYMDGDRIVSVGADEQTEYIDQYKANLLRYIEDAFLEDALVGISIDK